MIRLQPYDYGKPGTLRFRRTMTLNVTQREMASRCEVTQADIHNIELAKCRLTRARARKLSAGYWPDLLGDSEGAEQRVFQAWFESVRHYGDARMKRIAASMREAFVARGWSLPLMHCAHRSDAQAIEQLESGTSCEVAAHRRHA